MIIYLLIALAVFLLDQATKWIIKTRIPVGDTIPVLGDFFSIASIRNRGAAFGILQGQQLFFLVITVLFLIGISYYLYRMHKEGAKWSAVGLSMLLGGAVGNFLDRLIAGEVVDFFRFDFRFNLFGFQVDYMYPIFNVADIGIVLGAIIVLIHTFVLWRREGKDAKPAPEKAEDAANDTI